mmetsp:Transcript_32115/g.72881  ORF Transcript_32115/g.72881 Transcript_32115/m.72881 type:complete len:116 (+) Transcript_32115:109-456(+)
MAATLARSFLMAVLAMAAAAKSGSLLSVHSASSSSGNPLFAPDTCTEMFETMKKLGSSVPPNDFVAGCTEICEKVRQMKTYWGTGKDADYACEQGKKYGCAWAGTPPVTLSGIGC